jgi:hypothetical protein
MNWNLSNCLMVSVIEDELLKSNVSFDSFISMLVGNEKLKLDYSTCVEQFKIVRAEIIKINFKHSSTCSSTLNNDNCIDSNDNDDVLLDINASNVSTISYALCINLKHEIDDALCINLKHEIDDFK